MKPVAKSLSVILLAFTVIAGCAAKASRTSDCPSLTSPEPETEQTMQSTGLMAGRMLLVRIQRLDLSDEQCRHVGQIMRAAESDIADLRCKVRRIEKAQTALLTADIIDVDAVKSKCDEMAEIRKHIAARWVDAYVEVWNTLDAGQREEFRKMVGASEHIVTNGMSQ